MQSFGYVPKKDIRNLPDNVTSSITRSRFIALITHHFELQASKLQLTTFEENGPQTLWKFYVNLYSTSSHNTSRKESPFRVCSHRPCKTQAKVARVYRDATFWTSSCSCGSGFHRLRIPYVLLLWHLHRMTMVSGSMRVGLSGATSQRSTQARVQSLFQGISRSGLCSNKLCPSNKATLILLQRLP